MFYSHEILTSRQYGVATVWLVATIGIKQSRKVTRKAIQEVNVQKACETIIEPPGNVPIALRLQSNLLYGVSRVYSQKSLYLLGDAEKVQVQMKTYYNTLSNALDPLAGKAKRQQLILVDDPDFLPDMELPPLSLDEDGNLLLPDLSQQTRKTSSQLSPLQSGQSSAGRASFIDLNLPHSSPYGSLQLASPFGGSSATKKPGNDLIPMDFGAEEDLLVGDFGFAIDADGNLIEEPSLPPHRPQAGAQAGAAPLPNEEGAFVFDNDGDVQMKVGEQPLPDAEALPARRRPRKDNEAEPPSSPAPRRPRKAKKISPDNETRISREEYKSWTNNYVANAELARSLQPTVGPAQARRNAYNLVFGMGIAGVGMSTGVPGLEHPLAELFAGKALQERMLGQLVDPEAEASASPRGRRRSASTAFSDEDDERRVRPRLEEDGQHVGRGFEGQAEDIPMIFDQEPEVGRDPGSALSDLPSVPWNRPSSLVPSSVRSKHSAPHIPEGSPLVGRGSILPEIERYSDNMPAFGSDGFGPLPAKDSSMADLAPEVPMGTQATSQVMRDALDREGQNFLSFAEGVAREKGEDRYEEDDPDRRWVSFNDLFEPQDNTKAVAAQAFYHVLSLATKNALRVEQEGQNKKVPFGAIKLGLHVEDVDDDDETVEGHDGNDE